MVIKHLIYSLILCLVCSFGFAQKGISYQGVIVYPTSDGSKDVIMANHTYNEAQIDWFKAGSALNLIKEQNSAA